MNNDVAKIQKENLNKAIARAGGSVAALSEISGISARHIHDLKNGKKNYSKLSAMIFKMIANEEYINAKEQYVTDVNKQVLILSNIMKKIKSKKLFCEDVGISYEYLRRLEKGKSSWSFQVQVAIIKAAS